MALHSANDVTHNCYVCLQVSSSETTSQTMILNIQDVEEYLVDINLIQIEEEIGHGAFGVVHRGVVQSDSGVLGVGDEVALKLTKGKLPRMMPLWHSLCVHAR